LLPLQFLELLDGTADDDGSNVGSSDGSTVGAKEEVGATLPFSEAFFVFLIFFFFVLFFFFMGLSDFSPLPPFAFPLPTTLGAALGSSEGNALGSSNSMALGNSDGRALGNSDGMALGNSDGMLEGPELGASLVSIDVAETTKNAGPDEVLIPTVITNRIGRIAAVTMNERSLLLPPTRLRRCCRRRNSDPCLIISSNTSNKALAAERRIDRIVQAVALFAVVTLLRLTGRPRQEYHDHC
jgi:hypothetical protein